MNESQQNNIPEPIRSWCDRLTKALGDQLVSVVLFGGLAKGEFVPDQSDVNVAVVFHAITPEVLERAAPLLRDGTREFRLSTMLLTAGELRDSADVFPVKFLDLQRRHQVLWGGDPFAQLAINRDHLRLRCEQELRNLLLRLRTGPNCWKAP
jgi:predicted nucleotidyltransferase